MFCFRVFLTFAALVSIDWVVLLSFLFLWWCMDWKFFVLCVLLLNFWWGLIYNLFFVFLVFLLCSVTFRVNIFFGILEIVSRTSFFRVRCLGYFLLWMVLCFSDWCYCDFRVYFFDSGFFLCLKMLLLLCWCWCLVCLLLLLKYFVLMDVCWMWWWGELCVCVCDVVIVVVCLLFCLWLFGVMLNGVEWSVLSVWKWWLVWVWLELCYKGTRSSIAVI